MRRLLPCALTAWLAILTSAALGGPGDYTAVGKLRPAGKNAAGDPRYKLVDRYGMVRYEVGAGDVEDFSPFVNRPVGLVGTSTEINSDGTRILAVDRIDDLSPDGQAIRQAAYEAPLESAERYDPDYEELRGDPGLEGEGQEIYLDAGPYDEGFAGEEMPQRDWRAGRAAFSQHQAGPWRPFFVQVDYLNMRPRRGAIDFAIVDGDLDGSPEGGFASADFSRADGMHLVVGVPFDDCWELAGRYSFLRDEDSHAVAAPEGGQLWTTLTHPGNVNVAETAVATVQFDYDVFDAEIARYVELSDACELRLSGGWRFAWIDQQFDVVYDGGDATLTRVSSPIDLSAYGLTVGSQASWRLPRGWTVFGEAGASLLVADVDTRLLETDGDGEDTIVDVSDSQTRGVPVLELGIGVAKSWKNWNCHAGYKLSQWFDAVERRNFADDAHAGKSIAESSDLLLDGFYVGAGVGF